MIHLRFDHTLYGWDHKNPVLEISAGYLAQAAIRHKNFMGEFPKDWPECTPTAVCLRGVWAQQRPIALDGAVALFVHDKEIAWFPFYMMGCGGGITGYSLAPAKLLVPQLIKRADDHDKEIRLVVPEAPWEWGFEYDVLFTATCISCGNWDPIVEDSYCLNCVRDGEYE